MLLNDNEIHELCINGNMISPFVPNQVKEINGKRAVSFGLSSFGYDARLDHQFLICKSRLDRSYLDPKHDTTNLFDDYREDHSILIPPHGFVLAQTLEHFSMPPDVLALCIGKSTYARLGLVVNVTPLEPCWEGRVTMELSNTTDLPTRVYVGEGIAQFLFFKGNKPDVNYSTRNGKYQGQTKPTVAKV